MLLDLLKRVNRVRLTVQKNVIYNSLFVWIVSRYMRHIATEGYQSNICLKQGFLPVPVHYYSPIPDIHDLVERSVWNKKSILSGIDFNEQKQLDLLERIGNSYGSECNWSALPSGKALDFFTENNSFGFGCAAGLHGIIRSFKPKRIIEVGSGQSSRIIAQAIHLNANLNKQQCQYTIIDPYPQEFITHESIGYTELVQERVELTNSARFQSLQKNDILFIDSGHTVRIGGDVNYLFLDILPQLKPGVFVHIHDINLPYEYPKAYALNEHFRQFWTEQYLLQSFLTHNSEFEIVLAVYSLMKDHKTQFIKAFPHYTPQEHKSMSGSFWIRRK